MNAVAARAAGLVLLAGVAAPACDRVPSADDRSPAAPANAPVEAVEHTFYPREESEDYWETIRRVSVGDRFLLAIHPRIRTPAEGPWTAEFVDPGGAVLSAHPGLRVDVATGNFTFLCTTAAFAPGDWTLRLRVEQGGMAAGERARTYHFRVE